MPDLKVELISPFVEATRDVYKSFIGMPVHRRDLYLKKGYRMYGEVSAIIGLSGVVTGTCAISLSPGAAVRTVEKMLGEPIPQGVDCVEVRDGIGETVNMIAGMAKGTLSSTRYKFDITLPTIISGESHEFFQRLGTHCVVILFETEEHDLFTLEVSVASRD